MSDTNAQAFTIIQTITGQAQSNEINGVCFNTPCDAQAADYKPCRHCHPPICRLDVMNECI